jgi:hypothetical protein
MGSDLEFIPGDVGDAPLNNYFLEHGFQWLSGIQESFWNAPFFYPEPNVMTFSDNFLGTLPFYSAFRFSGFDREKSFQFWIITIFILNYIFCFWVLRRFKISSTGSSAGAFIFTFSLPVIAQLSHIQLLPRFMVPLAFYFTWRYLKKPDLKLLTGLCLSIIWQFYCTIYIGYFLVLALTAFVISCAIINAKDYRWREVLWISKSIFVYRTVIITVSCLILTPLLLPYYKASLEYGLRGWGQISTMLPRVQSFLLPVNGTLIWSRFRIMGDALPMAWEHEIFMGAFPWLAAFIAILGILRKDKDEISKIGGTVAISILLILLSVLYWNGFSFYKLITIVPGAKAIRAVTRIMLVLSFPFAIAAGALFTTFEDIISKKKLRYLSPVFSVILLSILVADQYVTAHTQPRYSKMDSQSRSRAIADEVLKRNPSAKVFAYMPPKDVYQPYTVHMYAMLASQSIHVPTINGYSGGLPKNYELHINYDKPWALKLWMTYTNERYGKPQSPTEGLFDGLVIIGVEDDNIENHSVTIAREAMVDDGFKAEISPASKEIKVKIHDSTILPVKITNKSRLTWPALGDFDEANKISLSYRWLSLDGEEIEWYNTRFPLHYDLLPSETMTLNVDIKAPSEPGVYIAEFDLVQEHVSWFAKKGSKTARVVVRTE